MNVTVTQPRTGGRTTTKPSAPVLVPAENPAMEAARSARGGVGLYGAFSIETFCSAGPAEPHP